VNEGRLDALGRILSDESLFQSGSATAGHVARRVKNNLQAVNARPEVARIIEKLRTELNGNESFRRVALPAKFSRIMLNRYEPGMEYGLHFDEAYIDGVRTDLSFTLFLNDPDSYDGGELEIVTSTGAQAIKLPAGCAVVYPGDRLHRVRPVTRGHRDACVGWVQSRVRAPEKREILYDLAGAIDALPVEDDHTLTLRHVRNRLLRMWAET